MPLQNGKSIIFGAYLYYPKLIVPELEYQKEEVQGLPHVNKQFTTEVLVEEEDYKKIKAKYKTVKAVKGAKVLDREEFVELFKMEPPYEADRYYLVKFSKKAYYSSNNDPAVPITVRRAKGWSGIPYDESKMIASGTKANVQFKERTWDNKWGVGMALDLKGVGVLDLVEYVRVDQDDDDMDYDDENVSDMAQGGMDYDDTPSTPTPQATTTANDDDDDGNW